MPYFKQSPRTPKLGSAGFSWILSGIVTTVVSFILISSMGCGFPGPPLPPLPVTPRQSDVVRVQKTTPQPTASASPTPSSAPAASKLPSPRKN